MKKEKTLIYIVYEAGNFQPALDLCVEIKKRRDVRCILYSPYFLPKTEEYIATALRFGFLYLHEVNPLGGDANLAEQIESASIEINAVAPKTDALPTSPFWVRLVNKFIRHRREEFLYWQSYYLNRVKFIENILYQLNISHVVFPEDNVERDSACWTKAIQKKGGKAFVISYASIAPHEAAIAYWSNADYAVNSIEDRLLILSMPQWRYIYNKKAMLRLPAIRALAMESVHLSPKKPWVVNTGKIDRILVESDFMRKMFVKRGVNPAFVEVTGTLPIDKIACSVAESKINHELQLKNLGCDPDKKTVVCAFPPNQYPNLLAKDCPTYVDLVNVFINGLELLKNKFNIIVSPHPSLSSEDVRQIESRAVIVYHGSVMDIISMADLYVASVSTTIKWALACGIPVVNYDCYKYNYDDYSDLPQVLECFEIDNYARTMLKFLNHDFHQAQKSISRNNATHFGVLDGKSIDRIDAVIFE